MTPRAARLSAWFFALSTSALGVSAAEAEQPAGRIVVDIAHERVYPPELTLHADLDDDDEDGVIDAVEEAPPLNDTYALELRATGSLTLEVEGPLALLEAGKRRTGPLSVRPQKASIALQATAVGPATLVVRSAMGEMRVPIAIAALRFLNAENTPIDPAHDALGVSRRITHDRSLPREQNPDARSEDPENFRVELEDPSARGEVVFARIEARSHKDAQPRVLRHVPLRRVGQSARFRSPFIRLVSDATDASAPDVESQVLRVRLRDRVHAVVPRGAMALSTTLSVGRAGKHGGPRSVLMGRLRIAVLRSHAGGPPVLGSSDHEALELARSQVEIANEVWAQCFVTFGDPAEADVRIVDPPPPALLAVSDLDGLPARGGGAIVFRADGVRIGPIPTLAGAVPEQTARAIARALKAQGFRAEVTLNPKAEMGAGPSADVVVRNQRGELAHLSSDPSFPLSSDLQQRVSIGQVDLADGLQEFDNALAAAGTLEERTLVKLMADNDPTTIDVILINHFVNRDRQGEAFIEADGSSMANVLVFDRNAVRYDRQAWVQAHELGHVLLDEAFHPDSVGADRPWLLMDSDAQKGRVTGPKRLRPEDCARVRRRSGPNAHPALLVPAP